MHSKFAAATFLAGAAMFAGAVLAAPPPPPGPGGGFGIMAADANHDGAVTKDEWTTSREARFAAMDKNGDGFVTKDELTPPGGAQGPMAGFADRMIQMMDKNGDGKISKDEYMAAQTAMFDRLDANHDGKITQDEVPARRGPMGGNGGQ